MNMQDKVRETINKHSMISANDSILLGLSGGADSVCLLITLNQLKHEYSHALHAVYIDHGLRPDETPNEIIFCQTLCKNLNIPLTIKTIYVLSYAKEQRSNKQEAARELRYKTFEETALEIGADKIALAHNADDQAETFFMRILRGAGQKGLSGIPAVRGKIIRPLIEVERREIEEFFDNNQQTYLTDSSNLKADYFRNWLRLAFMQELKKHNPNLINTISRISEIIREEDNYLEIIVTKTLMRLIHRKTDTKIELFLVPLESIDKVILRRILRRAIEAVKGLRGIGFVHTEEIIELIKKGRPGDRIILPKGIRVIKGYSTLILTSEQPSKLGAYNLNVSEELALKESGVTIKSSFADSAEISCDGKSRVIIDAERIKLPLIVRARKSGDLFYPFGFGKRKKLQDFFVDEKIPRDERDSIPIVLSGDDIIWIAGYRADERFKVTSETKKIIILEIKPAAGK